MSCPVAGAAYHVQLQSVVGSGLERAGQQSTRPGRIAKVIPPFTGPVFPHGVGADASRNARVLDTGSNLVTELS
jgi:hypothetical protein